MGVRERGGEKKRDRKTESVSYFILIFDSIALLNVSFFLNIYIYIYVKYNFKKKKDTKGQRSKTIGAF